MGVEKTIETLEGENGMTTKENAASDSEPIQDGALQTIDRKNSVADTFQEKKRKETDTPMLEEQKSKIELAQPSIRLGDVLDHIQALLTTYIKLPSKDSAMLIAIWIAETYCYRQFQYCGYLSIRSATPRCGKSQLLGLIARLSAENPPVTSFPTAAVLYRNPRKILVMDEVDQLRNQDKDTFGAVLSVLNSGFERGAVIERLEKGRGDKFEVKSFDVFGPKAIAGIERLADTLADRTFAIVLKRVRERMPRFRADRLKEELSEIREHLTLWMNEHEEAISSTYANLPTTLEILKGFDDRFQDIAEPLCTLAMLADEERPEGPSILDSLSKGLMMTISRREPTGREGAFQAFLDLVGPLVSYKPYKGDGKTDRFISTWQLLQKCQDHPDLSWLESGAALAGLLRSFDLSPISNGQERGYRLTRDGYDEWRERYPKPQLDQQAGPIDQGEGGALPQVVNH